VESCTEEEVQGAVIEVGGSRFGPQLPVNGVAFHHVGAMDACVLDGGAQQDFRYAAATVARCDDKAGHGPYSGGRPWVCGPGIGRRH
jgi:hypothetical protein